MAGNVELEFVSSGVKHIMLRILLPNFMQMFLCKWILPKNLRSIGQLLELFNFESSCYVKATQKLFHTVRIIVQNSHGAEDFKTSVRSATNRHKTRDLFLPVFVVIVKKCWLPMLRQCHCCRFSVPFWWVCFIPLQIWNSLWLCHIAKLYPL